MTTFAALVLFLLAVAIICGFTAYALTRKATRTEAEAGLFTVEDAAAWTSDLEAAEPDLSDPSESTPVFDVLASQWPALYAGRLRALKAPTIEIRAAFDLLVVDWLCSHCEADHMDCPGCSCVCLTVVAS